MTNSSASQTDRVERQIILKAPRSRVWRALTNAEEFGTWFGASLKGQTFAPGKRATGHMTSCGHEHIKFDALVVDMKPEHLFSYRWHPYAVDPAVDYSKEETTLVEMRLDEIEGGTLLKVVESGFDKVPAERRALAFQSHGEGWVAQLNNVAKYVDHV